MEDSNVSELLSTLDISEQQPKQNILVCDCGYSMPREKKPRKEKINAISRQLVNFLEWQMTTNINNNLAQVHVIGCPDESIKSVLENRTKQLLPKNKLPSHVLFSCSSLQEFCANRTEKAVYLSPDAHQSLDPSKAPGSIMVVGMLIDRRVQPNRSKDRASELEIVSQRWPLDECFAEIDPNEPLNVDCILEGMQQWWWNCETQISRESFLQAASQAIEHHAQRHPSRPVHLPVDNSTKN